MNFVTEMGRKRAILIDGIQRSLTYIIIHTLFVCRSGAVHTKNSVRMYSISRNNLKNKSFISNN
jgi:hypothetical protein